MIYRLYSWRLEKKDDTPGTTVELLMCIPHYCQILTILSFIAYFFPAFKNPNLNKLQVLSIALAFQLFYHLIIYNKERWMHYVIEFENETLTQRKKGTLFIYLYTIGSIALFLLILPILF